MGRAVGEWIVSFDDLRISGVEFEYLGDTLRISKENTENIRNVDHDLVEEAVIIVDLPKLIYCGTGYFEFKGHVRRVNKYPEGESIPTVGGGCSGEEDYCVVGKPHPVSTAMSPPKSDVYNPGVRLIALWWS